MKCIKGYKPLHITNREILLYRKGAIYSYDKRTHKISKTLHLNNNFVEKIKESNRLFSRLFRTNIRTSIMVNDSEMLFVKDKALYLASFTNENITKICNFREGFTNPLNICAPLDNSKLVAIFGDYGDNPKREKVNIYGVFNDYTVKKLFSFPENSIRHVHNIIRDSINNCYYVLTGDNEKDAGIYIIDHTFTKIKPIFVGSQKFRAVCGFVTERGLIYATDSVTEQNYIYLLKWNNQTPEIEVITKINGSCIYATQNKQGHFFSTTVESEESKGNKFMDFLSMKKGTGILSDEVHLILVKEDLSVITFDVYQKDKLPYKLFQYGSIKFPKGQEDQESLVAYPCSVKEREGSTVMYDI